jgi:hypothetical protein
MYDVNEIWILTNSDRCVKSTYILKREINVIKWKLKNHVRLVFFHCVSLYFSNSYVTGATSGAGTVTLLEPPNSHPYFSEVRVAKSLVFRVVFLSNIACIFVLFLLVIVIYVFQYLLEPVPDLPLCWGVLKHRAPFSGGGGPSSCHNILYYDLSNIA